MWQGPTDTVATTRTEDLGNDSDTWFDYLKMLIIPNVCLHWLSEFLHHAQTIVETHRMSMLCISCVRTLNTCMLGKAQMAELSRMKATLVKYTFGVECTTSLQSYP